MGSVVRLCSVKGCSGKHFGRGFCKNTAIHTCDTEPRTAAALLTTRDIVESSRKEEIQPSTT